MNFVYDPKVQADIAEHINYLTSVAGVQEILRRRDPALARQKLIFPTESYTADRSFEPILDGGRQGRQVTDAFEKVVNAT